MEDFEYLKKSECYTVENINDEELYKEIIIAMKLL